MVDVETGATQFASYLFASLKPPHLSRVHNSEIFLGWSQSHIFCVPKNTHLARHSFLILSMEKADTEDLTQMSVSKQLYIKDISDSSKKYTLEGSVSQTELHNAAPLTNINSCGSEHERNSFKNSTSVPNGIMTVLLKITLPGHCTKELCCLQVLAPKVSRGCT